MKLLLLVVLAIAIICIGVSFIFDFSPDKIPILTTPLNISHHDNLTQLNEGVVQFSFSQDTNPKSVSNHNYNTTTRTMTAADGNIYRPMDTGVVSMKDSRTFAFAITGTIAGENFTRTSTDYTWTWHSEKNGGDYLFWAENNDSQFVWKQYYHFYADTQPIDTMWNIPSKVMKVEHYLENNLADITNTQMFYYTTVSSGDVIERNGISYDVDTDVPIHIKKDITNETASINFNNDINFNFEDLVLNGFEINEFYIGGGAIVNHSASDIVAIGFTKNNGNFPNGTNVLIDPTWQSNSNIASGLGDVGDNSAPNVFQKDGTWYLIAGEHTGIFNGFNWTGSTWQSDSAIASGLGDVGARSSPTVFQKDGTWYLIAGEEAGDFNGFNWTGSTWQSDSAIASGLGNVGGYSHPTVFQKDSIWYLIAGEHHYAGIFNGFNWTGSTWQSDSAIASGLGDIGGVSAPTVFQKDSIWYLIAGENLGVFYGFNWTGSTWQSDSAIASGLGDVGDRSSPTVFQKDGTWYLIAGEGAGTFTGFHIISPTYQPPTPINLQNTTSIGWVNYTWSSDSGNVTDTYNVLHNDIWTNDSANTYMNNEVGQGNWSNITVYAWNSSGVGTLSAGSVSDQNMALSFGITSFAPTTPVNKVETESQLFNITASENCQCRWYINGSLKQTNTTQQMNHNYTNTSLELGYFNFSAVVNTSSGFTDMQTWWVTVEPTTTYIPPPPVLSNTTGGDFWANFTWTPGSGNTTNSYNVSYNDVWDNGTTTTYRNESASGGGWHNITVCAWNSSGVGTLSNTCGGDNIEAPSYKPPEPINLANTTGNFWVNHTWQADSGNVTDFWNVSVNGAWYNRSYAWYNDTYSAHDWQNISVWAWNNTAQGTMSD